MTTGKNTSSSPSANGPLVPWFFQFTTFESALHCANVTIILGDPRSTVNICNTLIAYHKVLMLTTFVVLFGHHLDSLEVDWSAQ